MKKGTFSGRTVQIMAFGIVIWTLCSAGLEMALEVLNHTYSLNVTTLWGDWHQAIYAMIFFWVVKGVVNTINKTETSGSYWGI
jgi:hypothetical protein